MSNVAQFLGTWISDDGPPFSRHTFTWVQQGGHLRGRWLIEASGIPRPASVQTRQGELQIGEPWLEKDVLLFHVNGGPFVTEFRIVGEQEAIVGAAVHTLPAQFAGVHHRTIEGHRVRFMRRSPVNG